jgi:hypothetical protein
MDVMQPPYPEYAQPKGLVVAAKAIPPGQYAIEYENKGAALGDSNVKAAISRGVMRAFLEKPYRATKQETVEECGLYTIEQTLLARMHFRYP